MSTHNVAEAAFLSERIVILSPRPARLKADITVPFSFPRDPELRRTAAYAEFVEYLLEQLHLAAAE